MPTSFSSGQQLGAAMAARSFSVTKLRCSNVMGNPSCVVLGAIVPYFIGKVNENPLFFSRLWPILGVSHRLQRFDIVTSTIEEEQP